MRALAVSILFVCLLAGGAAGGSYPERPITMVVAFPPGGADDASARVLQEPLQRALGQPVVIENLGGAGGMIGAAKAAHAEPDGYTLLLHQDALAAGMTLYPERSFDAAKDFVAIGMVNTAAVVLAGRPTLAPNDFQGLVRWMKQPDQTVHIGHPGIGSFGHLAEVLAAQELGAKVTQVPYRGAGPALVDLLAGQVDLGPIGTMIAAPLIHDGRLKAYTILGRRRVAELPDVPTMLELGYPKLDIDFWHMLLAPAGTPRPIVDTLNGALRVALADPKLVRTFADGGMDRYPADEETPEAARALLTREIARWGEVIRANRIASR